MIASSGATHPAWPVALAVAWCGLVLWWAWTRRPVGGRLTELVDAATPSARSRRRRPDAAGGGPGDTERAAVIRTAAAVRRPVDAVGRGVRRLAGLPRDPTADGQVGLAVVAASAAAAVSVGLVLPVGVGVWCIPWVARRRSRRRRSDAVLDDLPDMVDLLRLTLGSGTSLRLALVAVAPRCGPSIGAGLAKVSQRLERGATLADALGELRALGPAFVPVLDALLLSERHGAPIIPLLDRIADDARGARRRRSEEVARRVPVKLLFPLVFCTLPAFGLLTVVPLLVSALGRLSL